MAAQSRFLLRRIIQAVAVAGVLTAPAAMAQTPPINYDGSSTTYFITPNSMLRHGTSLLSKVYMTVGAEGLQIKGRGPCTVFVCPVTFNGIDLYARRSRLRLEGSQTAGGSGGGSYTGGGKQCAGITRTLRPGDESNEVRALQEILNKAGYNLKADGKYGRATTAAVETIQRRANLKVDGRVGPQTLSVLPC